MDVTFLSWKLHEVVYNVVHGEQPSAEICEQTMYSMDGLLLLQNYEKLAAHMNSLHDGHVKAELNLLVNGLLADYKPFSSFGYQDLFEKGYISVERWRSIQAALAEMDVARIEVGVDAVYESEASKAKRRFDEFRQRNSEASKSESAQEKIDTALKWVMPSPFEVIQTVDQTTSSHNDLRAVRIEYDPATFTALVDESDCFSSISIAPLTPPELEIDDYEEVPQIGFVDKCDESTKQDDPTQSQAHCPIASHWEARRAEIRHYLQGSCCCLEAALLKAIMTESSSRVKEILHASRRFSRARNKLRLSGMPLFDVDATTDVLTQLGLNVTSAGCDNSYMKMTALMIAVLKGNIKLVRWLLEAGADVNFSNDQGSALVVAAASKFKDIIGLLLSNGADLGDAMYALSNKWNTQLISDTKRLQAIQVLEEISVVAPESNKAGILFRQLHSKFSNEYARIMEVIRIQQTSQDWALGIERTPRLAWKSCMSMLRALIRGQVSQRVHEVVSLLIVIKSMAAVLDVRDDTGSASHVTQFSEDLWRWPLLFTASGDTREKFCDAVGVLWGVELNPDLYDGLFLSGVDDLTNKVFQDMAINLVQRISPSLYLYEDRNGQDSLLGSQSRLWDNQQNFGYVSKHISLEASKYPHISRPPDDDKDDPDEFSRRFSVLSSPPAIESERIFLILAAGAIFGIVLLFLIRKSTKGSFQLNALTKIVLRSLERCCCSPASRTNQASLQKPVLKAALQHVIHILQRETQPIYSTLPEMRKSAETDIGKGLVQSFSSLMDNLSSYMVLQTCPAPHHQLIIFTGETLGPFYSSGYALSAPCHKYTLE
jgi:hypothetical protein